VRNGRKKPYTAIGIERLKCVRCGRPATQQWAACADGNLWRPICTRCDIALNHLVLKFMRDPGAKGKLVAYRKQMRLGDK